MRFFASPAAYFLEVFGRTPASSDVDAYAYVIAADDGRLLYRENLTHNDAFTYRVWADTTGDMRCNDSPLVDYTPCHQGMPDNGSYPAENPNPPHSDGGLQHQPGWVS